MYKRVLYASDPRWASMAERLDVLMAGGDFRVLKDEARTRAGLIKTPEGGWVFVKRVRTGSWTKGLLVSARGSRVRRWLDGAAMLSRAGFHRPSPLAALEILNAGSVTECYLVCEALEGASVLSAAVLGGGKVPFLARRALLSAVISEVRRLHDAGLYTHDLQETNLMVQEKPGKAPRISFVDLEDFRSLRTVSWRRRLLNLVHLDRSIGRFLNRPARLRCLYEYLDTGKMAHNERRDMVRQVWELREDLETRRRMRAVAKSERQAVATPAEKLASVAAAAPDGFVPPPAR
jgi:hypothetical protein